jgi:hypothetical protein
MKRYHIGKGTALSILNEAGVVRGQRKATAEEIGEAARLYRAGWSLERIGQHLGFDGMTIYRHLIYLGVQMRRPWERR